MNMWFITSSNFPNADAEALRIETFCKMFMQLGYKTYVIGYGNTKYNDFFEYNGIDYLSLKRKSSNKIIKIFFFLTFTFRLKKFLKKVTTNECDIFMASDLRLSAIYCLKNFCKKNKLILLHDAIEWFSPEQFRMGKYDIRYVMKDLENRYALTSNVKIVAISEYLERFFTSKNCQVLRIPVIANVNETRRYIRKEGPIVITYAGSPGKKDCVTNMLKGISLLSSRELKKFKFNFIGFGVEKIVGEITEKELNSIKNYVEFHGRLPRSKVVEVIANSDFTMLLRDAELRYAKAGFPTKVVESLMLSTPIICNYSSDLNKYLMDSREIILVNNNDPHEFSIALKKVLDLSDSQLKQMKVDAFKSAKENFDSSNYIEKLSKFIEH